jgi:hypothetical protein
MMGRKQKAGAVPLQPFADRADLLRRRLLFGEDVVESEHHQGVSVSEHAFVDRQLVAGLVDPLKDGDWMARCLAGDLLEAEGRAVKQLKRSRNALKKLRSAPLGVSYAGQRTFRTSVMVEKRFSIAAGSRCASQG